MPSNITQIQTDFNRAASLYDQHAPLQRAVARELTQFASLSSPPRTPILDIGCGTGFVARELKQAVHQLDLAPKMCQIASQFGSVTQGDMHALPFDDGSFNSVFSSMTLQWSEPLTTVFAEISRILAPAGKAYIALPLSGTLEQLKCALDSINQPQRMLAFDDINMVLSAAKNSGLDVTIHETAPKTIWHNSTKALLDSIRRVGAGNKHNSRSNMLTKTDLHNINHFLESRYRTKQGLPATWQIGYLALNK